MPCVRCLPSKHLPNMNLSRVSLRQPTRSSRGSLNLFFDLFWAGINYHFLAVMGSRSPQLSELPPTRLTRA